MKGKPEEVISQLQGSIYNKVIGKRELTCYESDYIVLFSTLVGGRTKFHAVSNSAL